MDGKKTYQIVINGLTESLNAVESLNKQLDALEQRMDKIGATKIEVGGSSVNVSAVNEQLAAEKEVNKLKEESVKIDAKIAATQTDIYQKLNDGKAVYKEILAEQKAVAAQTRLEAGEYKNTMQGMKQELADIKTVLNTTDLGNGDQFQRLTARANALNSKLLEIEKSYGQFGRQVGDYANGVAEGIGKVAVNVGGIDRVFNSAKEAARTLGNELKNMAANGQQNTQAFKDLQQAVIELDSNIKDAKKPMDNLMDSMESVMAIANLGQGIRGLFGVDDAEIQKSIKNLVALQNVLKGIETINNQIKAKEGIGKWIAPISTGIDKATAKLLVFNKAMLGTGTAAKTAAVGINLFSKALKLAFTGGILIAVDYLVEKLMNLVESFKKVDKAAEDAKETQKAVSKAYAEGSATLLKYQTIVNNFNGTKKEEKKLVNELNSQLGTSLGTYKTLAEWMDVLTKKGAAYVQMLMLQAKAQAAFNRLVAAQEAEMNAREASTEDYRTFLNDIQDFISPGWGTKSANRARVAGIQAATAFREGAEEGFSDAQKEVQEYMKTNKIGDFSPQIEKNASKTKKAITDAERELAQSRISSMKEGLNKVITQLEEERKARLAKLDKNSKDYKKQELLINTVYNDRIVKAEQEWAKKMEQINNDLWIKIKNDAISNQKQALENIKSQYENEYSFDKLIGGFLKQSIGSYGIQGKNQLSTSTLDSLGFTATFDASKLMEDTRKLIELQRELTTVENKVKEISARRQLGDNSLEMEYDRESKALEKLSNEYDEYNKYLVKTYNERELSVAKEKLIEENYTKDLTQLFKQRMSAIETYWFMRAQFSETEAQEVYLKEKQIIDDAYEVEKEETKKHYRDLIQAADDAHQAEIEFLKGQLKAKMLTREQFQEEVKASEEEYSKNVLQIQKQQNDAEDAQEKKHEQDLIRIKEEKDDKRKELNKQYYATQLQELRDFQTALSDLESKQPVMTSFGFTALQKTFDNNKELLSGYEELAKKLIKARESINKSYKEGLIDKDVYESSIREIDRFSADLGDKMDEVKQKMSFTAQAQVLVSEISQYASQLGSALNSMLQAFAEYTDQQYENSINEIEKEIDRIQELYDEQEEILQKHKQNVDSIEDELATARGDRRQHLIDQLNEEIEAQRRAYAEEQKLEKQKKAEEAKKDEEEIERKKAQQRLAVSQAIVNGATAFMNALSQQPIWLGLALATMTAVMTAAQIATINSVKYASGGVIQGKSHSQGGVKVLGGTAEVEGGEMIVNRQTTSQNVDLLYYINSKKKRVDLDDLIEFYASGKPRKTIQSIRTRFADGGQLSIPQLDISDQLQNVVVNQDNRPIYVTVTDIENKMEQVRYVKTLAGLK